MYEWFNRHSAGMLVHMKPLLCIRYISYEICLCTSGRNDLCSWQSLAEPKIVVAHKKLTSCSRVILERPAFHVVRLPAFQ